MYVNEEDVHKLRKGRRDPTTSPITKASFNKLQLEVQDLKMKVTTLMRILNVRHDPLNMNAVEYELFYKSADQMSIEGWAPHVEESWAEMFVRFRVEDLEKIEAATQDPHPWRPFLRLASSMCSSPWNPELRDLLASGRTNIQHVAGMWCVLKDVSPRTFDTLVERDAAPFKKLMRRLRKSKEVKD